MLGDATAGDLAVATLVAAAWVYLPGLLIGAAARLRGLALWAFAPAFTTGICALTAVAAPIIGLRWSLGAAVGGFVCATLGAALLGLLRRDAGEATPVPLRQRLLTGLPPLAGLAIGASFVIWSLSQAWPAPDAVTQTYDGVFHLNLIEMFVQRGDASTLHAVITDPDAAGFYPAAFHDLATLSVLSGVSVPLAVNALTLVVAGLVWPGALTYLVQVVDNSSVAVALAGAAAGTLPQFPILFVYFGTLYPNLLSYALVPLALGLTWHILTRTRGWEFATHIILLLFVLGTVSITQTNGVFTYVFLVIPLTVIGAWRRPAWLAEAHSWGRPTVLLLRTGSLVAIAASLVALHVLTWYVPNRLTLMRKTVTNWDAVGSLAQGLVKIATLTVGNGLTYAVAPAAGVVIALMWGLALCAGTVVRQIRPLALFSAWLFALVLVNYVLHNPRRAYVFGWWYSDPERIFAWLPLGVIPLLAVVAAHTLGRVRPRLIRVGLAATLALVLPVGAALWPGNQAARVNVGDAFAIHERGSTNDALLSRQETRLLARLGKRLPTDAIFVGNPWDGSSYAWAIAGRRTLFPQPGLGYDATSPQAVIAGHLREVAANPAVCDALAATGAHYVLSFGREYELAPGLGSWQGEFYAGFTHLEGVPGLTEIDREGEAVAYEVTACPIR